MILPKELYGKLNLVLICAYSLTNIADVAIQIITDVMLSS